MKLSEIKVLINSKSERKAVKLILKSLGQPVADNFYIKTDRFNEDALVFNDTDVWSLGDRKVLEDKRTVSMEYLITRLVHDKLMAEKAEKLPILKSKDGFDLYEGDFYYIAKKGYNDKWSLDYHVCAYKTDGNKNKFILKRDIKRPKGDFVYFKSGDNATEWISEQNKVKSFKLFCDSSLPIEVFKNHIEIQTKTYERVRLEQKDLDLIFSSYKALNI